MLGQKYIPSALAARVPNGTQRSVQPQKGGGFRRLEHLGLDAASSKNFSFLTAETLPENAWSGIHTVQSLEVASPSTPDHQIFHQCHAISQFHQRTAKRGLLERSDQIPARGLVDHRWPFIASQTPWLCSSLSLLSPTQPHAPLPGTVRSCLRIQICDFPR